MLWHHFRATIATVLLVVFAGAHADSAPAPREQSVTFVGTVRDNNNKPIVGADVTIAGSRTVSGRSGQFRLVTRAQSAYGLVIEHRDFAYYSKELLRPTEAGIFSLTRASRAVVDPTSRIRLRDERRPEDCVASPSVPGSELPCDQGFAVDIPPNALVNDAGRAPSGRVEVKLATFEIHTESMPGPFSVAASDRDPTTETVMTPYGAGMVEIRDAQTGERLNLKPGAQAHIEIPIHRVAKLRTGPAAPPPTIPLLRFNETTLRWVRIGSLTRRGDTYVADVDHLTEFNADTQDSTWTCLYIQFWGSYPSQIANKTVSIEIRAANFFFGDGTTNSLINTVNFTTAETGPNLGSTYQLVYNLKPQVYYWGRAYNGSTLLTDDTATSAVWGFTQSPQNPPLPANPSFVCNYMNLWWDPSLFKAFHPGWWKDFDAISGAVTYDVGVHVIRSIDDPTVIARVPRKTPLLAIGSMRDQPWILVQTSRGVVGLAPRDGADLSKTRRPQKPRPGPRTDPDPARPH